MEPGADLLLEAGLERLRAKSVAQTESEAPVTTVTVEMGPKQADHPSGASFRIV